MSRRKEPIKPDSAAVLKSDPEFTIDEDILEDYNNIIRDTAQKHFHTRLAEFESLYSLKSPDKDKYPIKFLQFYMARANAIKADLSALQAFAKVASSVSARNKKQDASQKNLAATLAQMNQLMSDDDEEE